MSARAFFGCKGVLWLVSGELASGNGYFGLSDAFFGPWMGNRHREMDILGFPMLFSGLWVGNRHREMDNLGFPMLFSGLWVVN